VPTPAQLRAVVDAAHAAGVAVTVHALTVDLVSRALDAGVDELAHVPVEALPIELVERIAAAGIPVVSTLQAFFSAGIGRVPALNAAALRLAGVPLLYGTDLGNTGTLPGVDPRELDRLADAGLGRAGALLAATTGAAAAAGMRGRGGDGRLRIGDAARVVLLASDPLVEPAAWRRPLAVVSGRSVATGG
jgi:imidazolonepropionase-like amidohydrolase